MIETAMTTLAQSPIAIEDSLPEPTERRWTLEEYYRLAEEGFFDGQRVQLLEGRIYKMPPQGLPHTLAVERADNAVRKAFSQSHRFRIQMPFHTIDGSDPEPDVAVVPGTLSDAINSHPTQAALIIEVSDTSLRIDRKKSELYARSGIMDFWIINLVDGVVEIFRDPSTHGATTPASYRSTFVLNKNESVSPLAAPNSMIAVSDLLP
jgi:Uma2 family endonuclease